MIIPPRERATLTSFEEEYCDLLRNYVPHAMRERKAKAAKNKKKKRAAAKPTVSKKKPQVQRSSSSATGKNKITTLSAVAAFDARVAEARAATGSLTRQQSATAQKLAKKGSENFKWQYLDDSGRWSDYAPAGSVEVEKQFASWLVDPHVDVRCVKSGDWEYMVDFNAMMQQNIKHHNHKMRKVRRVPVNAAA